jgi:hypothetical protein
MATQNLKEPSDSHEEPSFSKWWNAHGSKFQFVGILIGIGALFLNIQIPDNEIAKTALLNLQFMWLFVITISLVILLWNLWMFSHDVEKSIEKKFRFRIPSTFSILTLAVSIFLIGSLWNYIYSLYGVQLLDFLDLIALPLEFFVFAVFAKVIGLIFNKLQNINFNFLISSMVVICVTALIRAALLQFTLLKFVWASFFVSFLSGLFIYLVLLGVALVVDFVAVRKGKYSIFFTI